MVLQTLSMVVMGDDDQCRLKTPLEIHQETEYRIGGFFIQHLYFLCELKMFIFGQLCLLKPSLKICQNVSTVL